MKRTVPKTIGPGAKILECRAQKGCRVNAPWVADPNVSKRIVLVGRGGRGEGGIKMDHFFVKKKKSNRAGGRRLIKRGPFLVQALRLLKESGAGLFPSVSCLDSQFWLSGKVSAGLPWYLSKLRRIFQSGHILNHLQSKVSDWKRLNTKSLVFPVPGKITKLQSSPHLSSFYNRIQTHSRTFKLYICLIVCTICRMPFVCCKPVRWWWAETCSSRWQESDTVTLEASCGMEHMVSRKQ